MLNNRGGGWPRGRPELGFDLKKKSNSSSVGARGRRYHRGRGGRLLVESRGISLKEKHLLIERGKGWTNSVLGGQL